MQVHIFLMMPLSLIYLVKQETKNTIISYTYANITTRIFLRRTTSYIVHKKKFTSFKMYQHDGEG